MAYIPIAEVPNAPANAPEMPLADYPDIPSIRARGIDMKVDMGGRAAALQKQELPGGFAQGLARASAAAGTGQAAMGEAISSGANQMSRAMSGAAGILQKIHNDTLDSEDDIASIKAKDNRETMLNMFNADAVKGEWTEEQKQENLPKYIEKLGQMNSGLGMRQMTRDKIAAQDTSFIHATSYKVEADMYLKKSKDNDDLANGKITTAKERGDAASLADGRDSNDFLHKRGRINDAQYKANDDEMNKSARKSTHMEQVANDPQWAKEQADKAAKGEPNDMFDKTDSPEYVNSIRGHANTELNRVREEKAADLLTEINKGGKNISVEYVNKYADDNHLSNTQRNTLLAAQRDPPIPYDDGRMSEALRLASTYDSTKDKDADGNPSLEDFNKRQNYIVENIPKEYRAELLKDLSPMTRLRPQNRARYYKHAGIQRFQTPFRTRRRTNRPWTLLISAGKASSNARTSRFSCSTASAGALAHRTSARATANPANGSGGFSFAEFLLGKLFWYLLRSSVATEATLTKGAIPCIVSCSTSFCHRSRRNNSTRP
jgi:hypothetical protein